MNLFRNVFLSVPLPSVEFKCELEFGIQHDAAIMNLLL